MKLTMLHRRRLALLLIISLLACVLLPASATLVSTGQSLCHSLSESHLSIDDSEISRTLISSLHHTGAYDYEPLCDEDPVPMPAELKSLQVGWWPVLLLPVLPVHQRAMHSVWRSRPRRSAPALRSHLAIGRIHV